MLPTTFLITPVLAGASIPTSKLNSLLELSTQHNQCSDVRFDFFMKLNKGWITIFPFFVVFIIHFFNSLQEHGLAVSYLFFPERERESSNSVTMFPHSQSRHLPVCSQSQVSGRYEACTVRRANVHQEE